MEKDFDRWNSKKKRIDKQEVFPRFHDGEIWWCVAGINIGSEIDGKHENYERPIFILKKCNQKIFIGIPCTSSNREGLFVYHFKTDNLDFILNFSQVRTLSSKRLLRKIANVPTYSEQEISDKFTNYIKRKPTQ